MEGVEIDPNRATLRCFAPNCGLRRAFYLNSNDLRYEAKDLSQRATVFSGPRELDVVRAFGSFDSCGSETIRRLVVFCSTAGCCFGDVGS